MPIDVREFLARQLNDHSESPSGVVQKTFYEWTEGHITDAVHLGLCYLYSILPVEFSSLEEFETTSADCVIDFCLACNKFLGVVNVEIDGVGCIETSKQDGETNNLMGLLDIGCPIGNSENPDDFEPYHWEIVNGSTCVVLFDRELPVGATIRYMCASAPDGIEMLNDDKLCEYLPLIADFALWWLFRTDSESRSNLERARLHFESIRDFVTTKLLLEFSLNEDDYNFGRRKVDD